MQKSRITIALLIAMLVIISGCTSSVCTPENAQSKTETKAPTVKECIELCRSYGISWRTQVTGQDADRGLLHCTCYAC